MITVEINFVCDGAMLLRATRPALRNHVCVDIFAATTRAAHEAPRAKAIEEAKARGWTVIAWRGQDRHLCPACSGLY